MPDSLITPLDPDSRDVEPGDVRARDSLSLASRWPIEAAVATACGSLHSENEDAHSALPGLGRVFVVADGVGGGAMAALASRHLVAHLHAALDHHRVDPVRVRSAMQQADRAIASRIAELTPASGAATVALCAPLSAACSKWLIAWVGDCRVYRLPEDAGHAVELLTRDDTYRNCNERPPSGGSPEDPARMVGNGATHAPNVQIHELALGELLMLCSDGVHKHVDASAWARLATGALPMAQRCADLITDARANGSVDDATVLMLRRVPQCALNSRCAP
jgi:serine/threonine protein phosphatase PrpC